MSAILTERGAVILVKELIEYTNVNTVYKIYNSLEFRVRLPVLGKRFVNKTAYFYKIIKPPDGGQLQKKILISRFCIFDLLKNNLIKSIDNKIPHGDLINPKKYNLKLYDNQKIVVDYLMKNIYNDEKKKLGLSSCTLKMKTGSGKTYVAIELIKRIGRKTLIILPSSIVLKQWIQIVEKMMPDLKIGQYYTRKKMDGDIVLMVVDSVLSKEFKFGKKQIIPSYKYFKKFGFVVYDEIHKYASPCRREIFWKTAFRCALGMSASIGRRHDKMDIVYLKHVGPVVDAAQIEGYNAKNIKFNGKIRVIRYYGPEEHTKPVLNPSNGYVCTSSTVATCLAKDPYRNQLIVNEAKKLHENGKYIYIFSESRDHLKTLHTLLVKNGINPNTPELDDENIKTIMGGATDDELAKARNQARIILVTYGYGDTGVSIDRFDSIILASPRKSFMDQKLGRITRQGGDLGSQREVIDIVDQNMSLSSQYYERKKEYKRREWAITESKIFHTDIQIEEK